MAWVPYALAAAPSIYSMMQGHPSAPGIPDYSKFALPDRSGYQKQLLDSGFNPQSELYKIASQQAMGSVQNDLVNRGLGNSSYGNQAISSAQATLAQKFLENELQRRIAAFQAATGYDISNSNIQAGLAGKTYDARMGQYGNQIAQQQGDMRDLQGLAGLGMSAYGNSQANSRADAAALQAQQNYDNYMKAAYPQQAPTGGYYQAPVYGRPGG